MRLSLVSFLAGLICMISGCGKTGSTPEPQPSSYSFSTMTVDGSSNGLAYTFTTVKPVIKLNFSEPINAGSISGNITLKIPGGSTFPVTTSVENNGSTIVVQPSSALSPFSNYNIDISTGLLSAKGGKINYAVSATLATGIDSLDKFPRISDSALLDLVQKQTLKYFYDFAHPVSGLARERNTSGDVVTSGGSGFGVMAIVTGISRSFITRQQGLDQLAKMVSFLKNKAQTFHGAYSHWLNGATGMAAPFSTKDNGADLVETSYLMQGLLTARQFFNGADANETSLRADINFLWNRVEWAWFRKNAENVLYWHWSPDYQWDMNVQVRGWSECLITYLLAASSTTSTIPKIVYDNGWANNGDMKNGGTYYGVHLPLGPTAGGPLFFAHYSFLGVNPVNLTDTYANYFTQNTAQTRINYNYCVANPKKFSGYSAACWGLTASDNNISGYAAQSPENDLGIISPTAAISSMPYTPTESMTALKFFYYKLGDKIFKEYGFTDAFNLSKTWFADSYLAIDQGPEIIMIENYRSGLIWNLFMSCPEVKTGMKNLGFQSPNL
ncbi:MAG: glucoamylase family protein [Chitinophagaceae bacterium]